MEKETFKYDAFISYRHCELDKFVAENLHHILENYDLPKSLKNKLNIQGKTFKRLFRDQEELPLSSNLEDPIIDALKDSKYLIVICSPRLKESLWCKKEIQTFKKLRGRKNILCVLVEGEPKDSFPEEVLFDEVEVKLKNGKVKKEKLLVEPLAADVRGQNKKVVLKKIKDEKLRLIASMCNLDYDDLKQRHKIRKQRRIIMTSLVIAAACLLFSLYTSMMLIKINSQQRTLKKHQALSLSTKALEYLNQDNRYNAVKSSYEALTKFDNVKMPYTPEAEYALVEALGLYDVGSSYKVVSQVETKGVADYIKTSIDTKYAAVYDESEEINLFNSDNLDIISTYKVNGLSFTRESFSFAGNDKLAYINKKGNVSLVNVKNGKSVQEIEKDDNSFVAVKGDYEGKIIALSDKKNIYIYNIKEDKLIKSISTKYNFKNELFFSSDSKYLFVASVDDSFDVTKQDKMVVHVINVSDGSEISQSAYDAGYFIGVVTKGDNAFYLLDNAFGTDFNMIVSSCNILSGKVNWYKSFNGDWGNIIDKPYYEKSNNIVVANHDNLRIIDSRTGDVVDLIKSDSEIINVFSYMDEEVYVLFTSSGKVYFASNKTNETYVVPGMFEFNINNYKSVLKSSKGFLQIPNNENRVVLYEEKFNKDMKELNTKLDYITDDSIPSTKLNDIIKEYNLANKNLVSRAFYDQKKEYLFVNYTNLDLAIYSVKDKKLIKMLNNVGKVNHYFGKDKYNRLYIGDMSNSYVFDERYNLVGHIKSLCKLEKDKVVILYNGKYYSIKIYNLDETLEIARKYLKK